MTWMFKGVFPDGQWMKVLSLQRRTRDKTGWENSRVNSGNKELSLAKAEWERDKAQEWIKPHLMDDTKMECGLQTAKEGQGKSQQS